MAQSSKPWDGIAVGDAIEAPYSSNEWAHIWNMLHGVGSIFPNYGIIPGTGDGTYDPLQVLQTSVASVNVEVHVGAALVNGKLYESDATKQLAVGANASGNPRIDLVVLRIDYTAQTIRQVIKQGTPAGSPVRPALIQSASIWEIPLADIAVANGFSTITQVNITDRRRGVSSTNAGWQPFAYGLGHIPNGAYNGSSQSLQEVAIPFNISGNMLVEQITFVAAESGNGFLMEWGIYFEDLNDGDVAANSILRSLGGRFNPGAFTTLVSGSPVSIPAIGGPVYLSPGTYWLAISGMSAFTSIIPGTLDANTNKAMVATGGVVLGQTIDFDSSWTPSTRSYGIRIDGRVFGQSAAF